MNRKFSEISGFKVIAVCLTKFHDQEQENFVRMLMEKGKKNNTKVCVFSCLTELTGNDKSQISEEKIFSLFHPADFDMVVLMTETFKKISIAREIADRALANNIPVVSFVRKLEGCINISLGFGNSFEKIVRHIIEGHSLKKVNFMAGMKGNDFSEERLSCYKKVLEENNIPFDESRIGYGDFWEEPTRKVMKKWLEKDKILPEAIICANDCMAITVIRELRKKGYDVPRDVLVSGFDGIEIERYFHPRLTTAQYDLEKVVELIYEIEDQLDQKKHFGDHLVDFKYRIGGSCGCNMNEVNEANEKIIDMAEQVAKNKSFDHDMYDMTVELNNINRINDIFREMPRFIELTMLKRIWICLNDDVINDKMEFIYQMIPSRRLRYSSGFSEKILCALGKYDGSYIKNKKFKRDDLLPHVEKVLKNAECLYFLPLNFQDSALGYLVVDMDFDTHSIENLQSFLMNLNHVLENARNHGEQENLFIRDSLTSLYNRRGFYKYINNCIDTALENGYSLTIMSIDMDGLKQINDHFGHMEGDLAIRQISRFMLDAAEPGDILSRFGGDEFVFSFSCENGEERAERIKSFILKRIKEFNKENDKNYKIGASIGIFTKVPDTELSLDFFLKNADDRMYREKAIHKEIDTTI